MIEIIIYAFINIIKFYDQQVYVSFQAVTFVQTSLLSLSSKKNNNNILLIYLNKTWEKVWKIYVNIAK